MKLGVTGTQQGMTPEQLYYAKTAIDVLNPAEIHHGDCIGADKEIHQIAIEKGIPTVVHPPTNPKKRAFCKGTVNLPPKDYLDRNHDIVDDCDFILAFPKESEEQMRSGTWATVRYARKSNAAHVVVDPGGFSQ